ncbi:hypothetical protein AA313_de0206598 [Arthrobotrys entomopaga]|nr:hypothetical protein AA313_de0206598 [Arthrobotrys entomopaga]
MSDTPTPIASLCGITFKNMMAVRTTNFFDNNGPENVLMVNPDCPEPAIIILPHRTQLNSMEIVACSTAHGKVPVPGQKCERVPYGASTANYNSNGRRMIVKARNPIDARGAFDGSGEISGNILQVPVHVPVNVCGNSIDVIGLLNPAFGNTCVDLDKRSEMSTLKATKVGDKGYVVFIRAIELEEIGKHH